jgi:thiol-disulfide isomerase/thioredoxin
MRGSNRRSHLLAGSLPLCLSLCLTVLLLPPTTTAQAPQPGDLLLGKPVPDFQVEPLSGDKLAISSLRGKTVVLFHWGTDCTPCTALVPVLNQVASHYAGRAVAFLAVADSGRFKLRLWLRNRPFSFQQTLGTPNSRELLGPFTPRILVIDASGKLVRDITERSQRNEDLERTRATLEKAIERALG